MMDACRKMDGWMVRYKEKRMAVKHFYESKNLYAKWMDGWNTWMVR